MEIYKSCNLKVKAVLTGDLLNGKWKHLDVGEEMGIFKKPKKEQSMITPKKIRPIDDDRLGIFFF